MNKSPTGQTTTKIESAIRCPERRAYISWFNNYVTVGKF